MAIIPFRHNWLSDPWEDAFDRFFNEWPELKSAEFMPPMDIYEEKGKIIIETPIVGVKPENIDISFKDNLLTIKGKNEKRSEVDEKNYYRKEVKYGNFYRSITLPRGVIGSKAKAIYKDGLLRLEIPRKSLKEEKKLKIKVINKK